MHHLFIIIHLYILIFYLILNLMFFDHLSMRLLFFVSIYDSSILNLLMMEYFISSCRCLDLILYLRYVIMRFIILIIRSLLIYVFVVFVNWVYIKESIRRLCDSFGKELWAFFTWVNIYIYINKL